MLRRFLLPPPPLASLKRGSTRKDRQKNARQKVQRESFSSKKNCKKSLLTRDTFIFSPRCLIYWALINFTDGWHTQPFREKQDNETKSTFSTFTTRGSTYVHTYVRFRCQCCRLPYCHLWTDEKWHTVGRPVISPNLILPASHIADFYTSDPKPTRWMR
jgi:hypothetical protein